jgi:hypothetical protein
MKKILLRLLVCMMPFPGMAQTIVPAGFVTGPWTASGSPYIVAGDIQCNDLDIQPGVDVRFQNGSGLVVYGGLHAMGTALLPIIFEADDTTGWSNFSIATGGTKGICVVSNNANDTTILDHCIIKDAKSIITSNTAFGLYAYASNLILSNSEIFHNYISFSSSVISIVYCSPQILNNSIHDNTGRACGGIDIEGSHGLISGNEIYNNSSGQGGGISCISLSDPTGPTITNNHIHDNRASFDGGGIMVQNGHPRQTGVTIDIGAVEYSVGSGILTHDGNLLRVFPNPGTGMVYINDGDPLMEIFVTDILGNTVLDIQYGNGIDVSALSAGVYFMTFQGENTNRLTLRFVKN